MDWGGEKLEQWFAALATVVAIVSALFAWSAARQAKRQADAVLGEVAPAFAAFQLPVEEFSSQSAFAVEIVNHNRRALLLHEFKFENPDAVILFSDSDDLDGLIASIMGSMEGRAQRWDVPLRIRGCGMNSEPHVLELKFRCGWKHGKARSPIKFCFRAEFSLEGKIDTEYGYGCTMILPPKHEF